MNREIKFRMWNNVTSKPDASRMFYDTEQVMECLKQQIYFDSGHILGYDHIGDGNAFMQFTGLLDKNGKEIFEGDIVKCFEDLDIEEIEHIAVVEFTDAQFVLADIEQPETWPFDNRTEIIGNIHENPELIKTQNP